MLWPARILIYTLAAWLGLWVIFPAAGEGIWGMILAAPTAAIAIGLDVFLSSRVLGISGEREAARRLKSVDRVLGEKPQFSEKHEEITVEAEEVHQLEESRSKSISPPSDR